MSSSNYLVEKLPNGLMRVLCRASLLTACFNPGGTFRHGDLGKLRSTPGGGPDWLTLDETLCRLDDLWGGKRGATASVPGSLIRGGDGGAQGT